MHSINDKYSRLLSTIDSKRDTMYKKHLIEYILRNNIIKREYYSIEDWFKIFKRQGRGGDQQDW